MRALLGVLAALAAHPLHTTLTQIELRGADGSVQLTVRAFSDDLRAALGGDVSDSAASRYVRSTVTLADRTGRAVRLAWCGLRRSDGVVWLCLRGTAPAAGGLRVRVAVLFELYADQINIVQTNREGRRAALLFTRGDPPRPVP
ncbi:MAG TPA: DUF6702 family protein [Gemmatimonadales bacterium]|jgi:hypothetical protein